MSSMVWASNDVLYAGSVNYGIWRFAASGGVGEKLRPDTASFRATHLVLSDDEKVLVYGRVGSAADRRVRLSVIRLRDGKRAAIDINGAAAGAAHSSTYVAASGKHLLMVKRAGSAPRRVLVHNWLREVRARLARR